MSTESSSFQQPLIEPVRDPGVFSGPPTYRMLGVLDEHEQLHDFALPWMGHLIVCPRGWEFDVASIPRIFWSLLGYTPDGLQRGAAAVHDRLCELKPDWCSSIDAADCYRHYALLAGTRSCKVTMHYWAIRIFGPRWKRKDEKSKMLGGVMAALLVAVTLTLTGCADLWMIAYRAKGGYYDRPAIIRPASPPSVPPAPAPVVPE